MLGLAPVSFIELIHLRVINKVVVQFIVLIGSSITVWILHNKEIC